MARIPKEFEQLLDLLSDSEKTFSKFFWQLVIGGDPKSVSFSSDCKLENEEGSGGKLEEEKTNWLTLCPTCLETVQQVKRLHSELEKIQLLLIDKVSEIHDIVKVCCSKGKRETVALKRKHSSKLIEFQHQVLSKRRNSSKIPIVFLEKFSLTSEKSLVDRACNPTSLKKDSDEGGVFVDNEHQIIENFTLHSKHEDSDMDWSPGGSAMEEDDDEDYAPEIEIRSRKMPLPHLSVEYSDSIPKRGRGRPPKNGLPKAVTKLKIKRVKGKHRRAFKGLSEDIRTDESAHVHDSIQDKANRVKKNYILMKKKTNTRKSRKPATIRKKRHHQNFPCDLCGKVYLKRPAYERHKLDHKQNPQENIERIQEMKECQVCNEPVDDAEYYSHLLSHEQPDGDKPFTCSLKHCPKKFQIEENLQIHMEVDHVELSFTPHQVAIKKCDVCNICFESNTDLLEHVKRAHKGHIGSLLRCPDCSYCFTTAENLISHMHSHAESDQQICFQCNTNFEDRSALLDHFQEEHNLTTSATCSVCQEEFSDLYWHKVHLRTEHKSKDIYICCYCGKHYCYLASLVNHINTHDRLQKTDFQCPDCEDYFRNENKLAQHRVTVHGAPKVSCEVCGSQYMTPYALSTHMKEHNKEGYHCEFCDKYYGTKARYDDHMRTHAEERKFACELCVFTCKTAGVLSRHRLTHTKPFVCKVCDRSFSRKFTLNAHMNMHTGASFVCHICGYEFSNRKSCNTHIKKYHTGDNPMPLYKPQKRRRPRLTWKDADGNLVIAKNASQYVDPARLIPSGSAVATRRSASSSNEPVPESSEIPDFKGFDTDVFC
ncbi:putative zinc finger protein [Orchesella cincta]|uniref:Putative zinc finger protein n=1 Tax=Orchesella cincta TaxID=48709 RepID=A0A1D2MVJ2_ORCCI|nr:putative zinc finger protein [Orchesella cincta]